MKYTIQDILKDANFVVDKTTNTFSLYNDSEKISYWSVNVNHDTVDLRNYLQNSQLKTVKSFYKCNNKAFLFVMLKDIEDVILSLEIVCLSENTSHIQLPDSNTIIGYFEEFNDDIVRSSLIIGKDTSNEQNKYYEVYAVAIKIGPENDRNYEALKHYIVSSDNRTYNKVIRNLTRVEYVAKEDSEKKESNNPYNMLVYGAPGTGKSYMLDELVEAEAKKWEAKFVQEEMGTRPEIEVDHVKEFKRQYVKRITFYEDYSYENFVGCYKPKPVDDLSRIDISYDNKKIEGQIEEKKISYEYEVGPFVETYIKAKNDPYHDYYLFIEEINRAKAASVFGDIFQLLDRENGESKYEISPEYSLKKYLRDNINGYQDKSIEDITMKLPNNMYIWATMNSADQGVFTLDSAFKRRWSFHYKDIVDYKRGKDICLMHDGKPQYINWDVFRMSINNVILLAGFDEDRCIGSFYFSDDELEKIEKYTNCSSEEEKRSMENPFVDKLLAYLRQDVFRMDLERIFCGKNNMSSIRTKVRKGDDITEILKIDINSVEVDDSMKEWKDMPESSKTDKKETIDE